MKDKTIEGKFDISYEDVGFHNASFDLEATAISQEADGPRYFAKISDRQLRKGNKEICGMSTCQCGGSLSPNSSAGDGNWWIEVDPGQLSSDDWDEIMGNE
jgi:hypothetical protein